MLHTTLEGVVESQHNAVGRVGHIARLNAVERTRLRLLQALANLLEEGTANSATGHTDRTLNDGDILLLGVHICLLECRRGIALLSGNEACSHLNAIGSQLHCAIDIFSRVNSSGCNDRNVDIVLLAKLANLLDNLRQYRLERILLIVDLIVLEAQVTTCLRTLNYDGVRNVIVVSQPLLAQQLGCTCRRYDRCKFGLGTLGQERGQVQGQSCTRKDDVRLLGDRGLNHIRKIGHSDHHIDADNTARCLTSLAQLLLKTPDAGLIVVARMLLVDHAQTGRRDNADTALVSHCRGQTRKRNADAHTALDDGYVGE